MRALVTKLQRTLSLIIKSRYRCRNRVSYDHRHHISFTT